MNASLNGRLEEFILPQVISLMEMVQSSGWLEISGPSGTGQIDLRRGQIVGARLDGVVGELAAYLMLSWSNGEFRFTRSAGEPPGDLGRSNQALCLEAMRLLDESRNADTAVVGSGRCLAQDEDVEPLPRVLAAIEAGSSSVQDIALACRISPLEAYYHVERLERAQAVTRIAGRSPAEAGPPTETVRVLVVDDSEFMRRTLIRLFESDPQIKVVGAAASGQEALAMLPTCRPNVVSLDLHMPDMDGVTTLKRIMLTDPTPTIIMTASSPDALDLTFETILRFGAIDFITKPSRSRGDLDGQGRYILRRLRSAARVNLHGIRLFQPRLSVVSRRAHPGKCQALAVALGGTGACLSFMQLLSNLPADLPLGLLGVLPFPDDFLRAFVGYLNKYSAFQVQLGADGVALASGVCHLVNGAAPVSLAEEGGATVLRVGPASRAWDPNLLLYDASRIFQRQSVGLLLSSEARDLTGGFAAIRTAGGMTLAQLPDTCVDPEGPAEALKGGCIDRPTVLNRISHDLSQFFTDRLSNARRHDGTREGAETWPRRSA